MRKRFPNQHELAAMWHFHDRYAASDLSAIDFFQSLSERERRFIVDMVQDIVTAPKPAR